jgi:hypothetical protein
MKKILLVVACLMLPASTLAQDTPIPPAMGDVDANADGKIDKDETKALVDKEASVADTVSDVGDVADAVGGLKGKSGKGLAMAIALLLATIFKMLLSFVKILSKNTGWFDGARGKAALKYTTLALGALAALGAGVAASMGAGLDWLDIAIIAGSGPGSMVVHELSSLLPGVGKHASVPGSDA